MGSMPHFLEHRPPRARSVAPNAAIVLERYDPSEKLTLVARHGKHEIAIVVEEIAWFSHDSSRATQYYLVRPTTGDWPARKIVIEPTSGAFRDKLTVTIGKERDTPRARLRERGECALVAAGYRSANRRDHAHRCRGQ